ncbi:hypothetical protein, partial [Azotobacter salinestris]
AYSASAKDSCFIGKLGQGSGCISPESGSLFQDFPNENINVTKKNGYCQGQCLKQHTAMHPLDPIPVLIQAEGANATDDPTATNPPAIAPYPPAEDRPRHHPLATALALNLVVSHLKSLLVRHFHLPR